MNMEETQAAVKDVDGMAILKAILKRQSAAGKTAAMRAVTAPMAAVMTKGIMAGAQAAANMAEVQVQAAAMARDGMAIPAATLKQLNVAGKTVAAVAAQAAGTKTVIMAEAQTATIRAVASTVTAAGSVILKDIPKHQKEAGKTVAVAGDHLTEIMTWITTEAQAAVVRAEIQAGAMADGSVTQKDTQKQ